MLLSYSYWSNMFATLFIMENVKFIFEMIMIIERIVVWLKLKFDIIALHKNIVWRVIWTKFQFNPDWVGPCNFSSASAYPPWKIIQQHNMNSGGSVLRGGRIVNVVGHCESSWIDDGKYCKHRIRCSKQWWMNPCFPCSTPSWAGPV